MASSNCVRSRHSSPTDATYFIGYSIYFVGTIGNSFSLLIILYVLSAIYSIYPASNVDETYLIDDRVHSGGDFGEAYVFFLSFFFSFCIRMQDLEKFYL